MFSIEVYPENEDRVSRIEVNLENGHNSSGLNCIL